MAITFGYNALEKVIRGGIVYIAEWIGSTPPDDGDFVNIGDVNKFSINPKVTVIKSTTCQNGLKEVDAVDPTMVENELTFTVTQENQDVLALFVLGTKISTNEVQPFTNLSQEYSIKFVPAAVRGEEWIERYWRVRITPSGARDLLSPDKYGEVQFRADVLADYTNNPTNPWGSMIKQTA